MTGTTSTRSSDEACTSSTDDLAVVAGPHDEVGEGGGALARGHVDDHDRARHRDAGGDVDHHRIGDEGVVQRHEGVGRLAHRRADQLGLVVAGDADAHALGHEAVVDRHRHDPAVGHDDGGRPLGHGVHQRPGHPPARCRRPAAGAAGAKSSSARSSMRL